MADTIGPGQKSAPQEHSGTMIETDEDIRQALLPGLKGQQQNVTVEPKVAVPTPQQPAGRVASPYRPTVRPAVAMLTVCDDGKLEGENIRIRDHRFVIGGTEGNLTIPIDSRISSRHVEITHQIVCGLHHWVITDLQITHGMFVRVSRKALADELPHRPRPGPYKVLLHLLIPPVGERSARLERLGLTDQMRRECRIVSARTDNSHRR